MFLKTSIGATVISLLVSIFITSASASGIYPDALIHEITNGLNDRTAGSSQALLVINRVSESIPVEIYALEKKNGQWERTFPPLKASIGRKGFAMPGEKREGDGKTPSGIFLLETVFGYNESAPTRMPYRQATKDDLWIDDINAPDYNRWVKRSATSATSFEEMRRKDDLYKYGIVIEYNTRPVVKGMGSAIFVHIHRGEGMPTAGCVALAEGDLLRILQWLDPKAAPIIVMGTEKSLRGMSK